MRGICCCKGACCQKQQIAPRPCASGRCMLLGMCCRSMVDQVLMWSSVYQTRRQTSRTKVAGVRNMPASTCSVHGPWAVAAHRSRDDGGLCAIARRFRHDLLVHGLSFTRRGVGACRSRGGLHGKGGGGSTRLLIARVWTHRSMRENERDISFKGPTGPSVPYIGIGHTRPISM